MDSFRIFTEKQCNVKANELKPGDNVENINKDCKEKGAKGTVKSVEEVKDGNKTAGNVVKIKVKNKGKNFKPGDTIKKTEIQLRKTN
jgi:hypothetical protein